MDFKSNVTEETKPVVVGENGTTRIYIGSGVPSNAVGSDGDVWIPNSTTSAMYTKQSGAWVKVLETSSGSSTPLGNASPLSLADVAAAGVATSASREDHVHPNTGLIKHSIADVKGDLLVATTNDTFAKLAAGANDTVLMADSTTGSGLKYQAILGSTLPSALGTAAAGSGYELSRVNHVHPTTGLMVAGTGTSTKIWVQSSAPATPSTGDLWFW